MLDNALFLLGLNADGQAVNTFTPASISPLAWWDFSDLSTMFQSGSRAAPGAAVSATNDPVGLVLDKSGNGYDLSQATSTWRPTLQTDAGGRHYLKFDGLDDALFTSVKPAWGATNDLFFAMHNDTGDTQWLAMYDFTAAVFIGATSPGVGSSPNGGAGAPADLINGVAVSPDTRDGLLTAFGSVPRVYEADGAGAGVFDSARFFGYSGFAFAGRSYGIILAPALASADRAKVRTWLGAKAGITL